MSNLSKDNSSYKRLLAQFNLMATKVINELSETVETHIENQEQTNLDLYQKYEFVHHSAKETQDRVRRLEEAEGYIEAVRLCSLVDWPTDEGFTSTIGKELTTLSRLLGYEKKTRPHPRYKKGIGQYHPVVCKKYLQKKNVFIPKELKYIIE
tara:strand:- start:27 stop:482 length:456 start_codon:yes stop_codon:yes gene_type:complete